MMLIIGIVVLVVVLFAIALFAECDDDGCSEPPEFGSMYCSLHSNFPSTRSTDKE